MKLNLVNYLFLPTTTSFSSLNQSATHTRVCVCVSNLAEVKGKRGWAGGGGGGGVCVGGQQAAANCKQTDEHQAQIQPQAAEAGLGAYRGVALL